MSRLKELIREYCPDGVEYRKIRDLTYYEQPGKYLVRSTYYNDSFEIPVLTAGQTFVLGYTNETDGVYPASKEKPVIIFDDFTAAFKWVDFPFKAKSSAMKMITSDEKLAILRYIFHVMGLLNYTSNEHTRLWIGTYSEFEIPLPPLPVQQEIVRILDSFTDYKAELEAELQARKKQYEFYKDVLLTFDNDTEYIPLRNLVDFRNGKGHEKNIVPNGEYVVINSKFVSTDGKVKKYSDKQISPLFVDDIVMVMSDLPNGKALAKCFLVDKDDVYTLNQRIGAFHNKTDIIKTRYLKYVLNRNAQLLSYDNGVDQTNLKKNEILDILIPVPSLNKQNQIIRAMDMFENICDNFEFSLPAEIMSRQKQYEYYREKLLSFERTDYS